VAGTSGQSINGTSGISGGSFTNQPDFLVRTTGTATVQSVSFLKADITNTRLGINNNSPSYTLDVGGTIYASGDVVAYSDQRVKDNVVTISDALNKVRSMRGVNYTRNDIEDKSLKMGVIAQEVQKVVPEVITIRESDGHLAVAYANLVGLLIEAIKDLDKEIQDLKK
jgi:hypothetical protein